MDEDKFFRLLDEADKDLDAFPFWGIFKRACKANPIKGIETLTPGRQAMLILWEANSQVRNENGKLESLPLYGDDMADKLQKLKDDLIRHFMNEDIDEAALDKFFRIVASKIRP